MVSHETQNIDFEKKTFIERVRTDCGVDLSSHAFVSLFLWQKAMGLSLLCDTDFFAVKYGNENRNKWFFPCGNLQKKYDFISEKIPDKSFSLCYMRKSDVKWLDENFPNMWSFRRDETADEYICNISDYVSLGGSKFSEIRRKIRKIDREHSIIVCRISDENLDDAMNVVGRWYETEHFKGQNGLSDDMIAKEALSQRKELGIDGVVLYADGVPVGVFAGFPLSKNTVDVLIGKCTSDAPKGMAYYALREYLCTLDRTFVYCNHEEDLGIEGIRQMKQSLCPCSMNEMWEAFPK